MICFGPIPSRRLGKSLGINNIPNQKTCSYSCVYCQVGVKQRYSINRLAFYNPEIIVRETESYLNKLAKEELPDYITFVPNGEPTLDINLGKSIRLLKSFHIPIAVITNGSMMFLSDVKEDLFEADWVSVKVDAAEEYLWRAVNRPKHGLIFDVIQENILQFAHQYKGILVTETMLIKGLNDSRDSLMQTAHSVAQLFPRIAYLSVPTRPPALSSAKPSTDETINEAYQIFTGQHIPTELILGFEGTHTGYTGNATHDILAMSAVHPIRQDTIKELLTKDQADQNVLIELLNSGQVVELEYNGNKFYLRKR